MLNNRISIKSLIYLLLVFFILISGLSIYTAITRIGTTKISIEVIPNDATLTANNKQINSGDIYLKPGTYLFKAKRIGFTEDSVKITVGKESQKIALLPEPKSGSAKEWINDHPDIQAKREELGGYMSSVKGEYVTKQTPIIQSLPYTDTDGPFSINYGSSSDRTYGSFLLVSNSTPQGRQAALQWIRKQHHNPTDLEIIFQDFVNPLTLSNEEEEE